MFKNVSKPQLTLYFSTALLSFLQAINLWGERKAASLFFLTSSILFLLFSIIGLMLFRKQQRSSN
ncbi:hypothetical protein ABE61_18430 [Lysinibacillus sphaericus]|uniref:hypothetical protein n=1 Tax=Lysinibacillus sphaericus TaxID=1421 RepID=UPI0018CE76E0|nr:hypothetical protein [Lysinibacillus sphaericus]MBG9455965.1 hypothetical protein [Lysinibacillus sphaericus]MBG9479610.1 hypothetical protein [Lysinibacillus sphaericus]MBG9593908.1 hypothetical protein [Lysinibacillus sphaericus]